MLKLVKYSQSYGPNKVCDRKKDKQEKEKEIEQKESEIREYTEEDEDEMDNIVNPNYKL